MNRVQHTLEPIYNENSEILILGSMPSVTSRQEGKYYAHKTNRFWVVMSLVFNEKIEDWKKFILKHNLALWDVIGECDIIGSSDNTIKNVVVNDIEGLLKKTKIKKIFVLGKKAYDLYNKYLKDMLRIDAIYLPSTSSANAQFTTEQLADIYSIFKKDEEN